jgi:hypothetical protein
MPVMICPTILLGSDYDYAERWVRRSEVSFSGLGINLGGGLNLNVMSRMAVQIGAFENRSSFLIWTPNIKIHSLVKNSISKWRACG